MSFHSAGSALVSISSDVTLRRVRLVLGWVIVPGYVSSHPDHLSFPSRAGSVNHGWPVSVGHAGTTGCVDVISSVRDIQCMLTAGSTPLKHFYDIR